MFWLELPTGNAALIGAEPTAKVREVVRRCLRVLVVDDNALNRAVAEAFLKSGGHEVVCLDNGIAAVGAAASEDFDLIMMDVRMPGMDGLEATRLIRALTGTRAKVPVMAVTAQAFAEQIEICHKAGMASHISKPYHRETLLAAVDRAAPEPLETVIATVPPTALAVADPELAIFDRVTFEEAAAYLPPEDLVSYLRTVITHCEAMLCELRAPDMFEHANELAELLISQHYT